MSDVHQEIADRLADTPPGGQAGAADILREAPLSETEREGWRRLLDQLGEVPPQPVGIAAAVLRRIDTPARSFGWRASVFFVGASVAALALLFVQPGADPEEFRARGAAGLEDDWVGVQALRPEAGRYVPIDSLRSDESIAVAVRQSGPRSYAYVAVFARQSEGTVRWFFPAWTDAADRPRSVAAPAAGLWEVLPAEVKHHFGKGQVSLIAVFSPRPLDVVEVERAVAEAPMGARLGLPDTAQAIVELRVD